MAAIPNQISTESPEPSRTTGEASPNRKWVGLVLWVGAIGALVTVVAIGSFHLLSRASLVPQKMKISAPLTKKSGLSSMEGFLIPFSERGKYTCLTLNLSLEWAEKNAEKELGPKVEEIRGIIYEALRNQLKGTDEVPTAESVKETVLSAVKKVALPSRIRHVYITRFLAI